MLVNYWLLHFLLREDLVEDLRLLDVDFTLSLLLADPEVVHGIIRVNRLYHRLVARLALVLHGFLKE